MSTVKRMISLCVVSIHMSGAMIQEFSGLESVNSEEKRSKYGALRHPASTFFLVFLFTLFAFILVPKYDLKQDELTPTTPGDVKNGYQ